MIPDEEKHGVFYRLNQKGDEEQVVAKDGEREETLNELTDSIDELLESIETGEVLPAMSPEQQMWERTVNQPSPPQLVASRGDSIRANGDTITNMTGSAPMAANSPETSRALAPLGASPYSDIPDKNTLQYTGAMHSESFTGTGAVAMRPAALPDTNAEDDDMAQEEILNEWLPEFAGGDYEPGDYEMPSPVGDGVAARKPSTSKVGHVETDTSDMGKEWPRKHNETAAMCDVDDDGVEHKPQGGHESAHAEADDQIQDKVGHDWPKDAHNSGSGVAEPFKGDRWSEGGVLKGQAPSEFSIDDSGPGMPSEGPITGTSGPQLGQPSNEWSPTKIGNMLGEDVDLQALFDSYARQSTHVCLEDFQDLCRAHGLGVTLDESSMLRLMNDNSAFVFFSGSDASGKYWVPTIEEGTTSDGKVLSELQIRSPEDEANLHHHMHDRDRDSPDAMDMGDFGVGDQPLADLDVGGPEMAGGPDMMGGHEDGEMGPDLGRAGDMLGDEGMMSGECPGCGYKGDDETCPECGTQMDVGMGGEEAFPDLRGGHNEMPGMRNQMRGFRPSDARSPFEESSIEMSPQIMESLRNFMTSVKSIISNSSVTNRANVAEALTHSWLYHAKQLDPRTAPTPVKKTLEEMTKRFPGFDPFSLIRESGRDAIDPPDGTKIGTGGVDTHSEFLPEHDTHMTQIGSKENPLTRSQESTYTETPTIDGTAKGMSGKGEAPAAVHENISRLARYVKETIREAATALRGKYNLSFSVVVNECDAKCRSAKRKNKTKKRNRLSEALADAEEILQFHDPKDVALETSFHDMKGSVIVKQDIPLLTIAPRGPIFAEGATLFRFRRNAERFATELVAEGVTCKVLPHNWGVAVSARVPRQLAEQAFGTITEKDWLKNAVNPDHRGFCTPMSKKTCTPRRKALAKRFKSGDLHHAKD